MTTAQFTYLGMDDNGDTLGTSCNRCGALVIVRHQPLHLAWHDLYDKENHAPTES